MSPPCGSRTREEPRWCQSGGALLVAKLSCAEAGRRNLALGADRTSYVNAASVSQVRDERSVRSGRARPQRAVHRLQAPLAPSGPQPTDGAFLCAVYPSGKKNASVWRSPSRDAGLKNGPESKLSRVRAILLLPSGSSRLDCGNPERYQMNRSSGVSERR